MAKNTVTAYLKEDEARRFKAACALNGETVTTVLRELVLAKLAAEEIAARNALAKE